MTEPPTIQLLRAWRRGDRAALERLIARNLDWVASYVHRRLGPMLRRSEETQDLVQEAMADVLAYGPRFEIGDEDQFRGLLARIVENNIRDRKRWMLRNRRDVGRECAGVPESVVRLDAAAGSVTTPSEAAGRNEDVQWVRLALELLEPEDRDVIWLREWEKMPFETVGQRLGVSANTARMRFQRAVPRLARKVKELHQGRVCDGP